MDQEMMKKVNEVLKANGRRELSMDEADQVVGGKAIPGPEKGTVYLNGILTSEPDFNQVYYDITRCFGYDVAIQFFYQSTGYTCSEMSPSYHFQGDKSDMDKMGIVLHRFWLNMDGESNH